MARKSFTIELYLLFLFAVLESTVSYVATYSEEENFYYINQVLDKLNNRDDCQLPTYAEIDELNASFEDLSAQFGGREKLNSVLNDDQKLVQETVLDQWDSFQKRMTSGVVIRTAKKRSFLCKIEDYQKAKHGFSICVKLIDPSNRSSDKIFEKNPIVRYVKHVQTHDVVEHDEEEPEVIRTPIVSKEEPVNDLDLKPIKVEPQVKKDADEVKVDNNDSSEKEEEFDPLAGVPIPPVSDGDILDEVPMSSPDSNGISNRDIDEEVEELLDLPIWEEPLTPTPTPASTTTTTTTPTPTLERPDLPYSTAPSYNKEVETVIESPLNANIDAVDGSANKAEVDTLFQDQHLKPFKETKQQQPEKVVEDDVEFVDELEDERDLQRLNKVEPTDWDFDHIYGEFKWPDEHPYDNVCNFDSSVKARWINFLSEPFEFKLEEAGEEAPFRFKDLEQGRNLRKRKKEFLKSIHDSKRIYESDVNLGMIDQPDADIMPNRPRWRTVADNNFCKFSYNRDYIGNTKPVKAVKGLFSGNNEKKRLMS